MQVGVSNRMSLKAPSRGLDPTLQCTAHGGLPVHFKSSAPSDLPSSASDGIRAQPNAVHVSVEGPTQSYTPAPAAIGADPQVLHQIQPTEVCDRRPSDLSVQEPDMTVSAVLSVWNTHASQLQGCQQAEAAQAPTWDIKHAQQDATVDEDDITVAQGGCCGRIYLKDADIAGKEVDFSVFTRQAFENGLSGSPHDILRWVFKHHVLSPFTSLSTQLASLMWFAHFFARGKTFHSL